MKRPLLLVTFFINGITSILGYSVMLNSLDYFAQVYIGENVYLAFPIPYAVTCSLISISYNAIHRRFSARKLIVIGTILNIFALVALLLTSIIFKNEPKIGFFVSLLFSGLIGVSSNLV
jgi:Na+/melibiose symporter-like transporter